MHSLLIGLLMLTSLVAAQAQTSSTSGASTGTAPRIPSTQITEQATSLPKDFLGLADLRATTNADIANLEREARFLEETRIPRAESEQQRVTMLKARLATLESAPKRDQEELQRLRDEIDFRTRENASDPVKLSERLGQIRLQLSQKRSLATEIQKSLVAMLSPEQEFKRTMSMMFAGLIGTVIIGFFIIAFRDDKIRQAIFSGETGIQFLTLFSLVIAIILFGITQILEGKELSALLGGLSGYILGRTIPRS